MHQQAEAADDRKGDEAGRHDAAHESVEQHDRELPRDVAVELALPGGAIAKAVGQLAKPERPRRAGEQVEQDLEADARHPGAHAVDEAVVPDHEEAAHRIVQLDLERPAAQARRRPADRGPRRAPGADGAVLDVATADDDVELAVGHQLDHARQQRLVVLVVGVDDGEERCRRGEHAFEAGRRQAAPADALDAAHPRVGLGHGAQRDAGVVGRVVVDEDELPVDAGQGLGDGLLQGGDVAGLVEGRDDDGELRHGVADRQLAMGAPDRRGWPR